MSSRIPGLNLLTKSNSYTGRKEADNRLTECITSFKNIEGELENLLLECDNCKIEMSEAQEKYLGNDSEIINLDGQKFGL